MPFSVWTQPSTRRAFASDTPPSMAAPPAVHMHLARGEAGSVQIVVRVDASAPLRSVALTTSSLIAASGKSDIAAENIEWQQVGFIEVTEIHFPHTWGARKLAPGWYPDPLLPVDSFDVTPGNTQPIWVTVHVPLDAPPGEYTGELRLTAHHESPVIIPLRITVHSPMIAPGAGHLRTSFDLLDGFLEQNYGKPLPHRISRRYGEFLLRHRLNPDDFSRNDVPDLDELRHYRKLGMNSFCAINFAKHRGSTIRGGLNSPPEWFTEANWDELARRVEPFLAELRKDPDLWRMAYVHGFDERDIDTHGDAMRLFFGRAKERWGLPTLTTSHIPTDPAVMRDLCVDWLCPILAQYVYAYDFTKAEAARAQGLKVWSYISLEPYKPFPNWRLDSPLLETRTIWWQAFHQKMDGFLYWGVNIWDREGNSRIVDPRSNPRNNPRIDFKIVTPGDHDWLYGDGVLLYPGPDGPIGSIRLANIRDGLQDYELLWLLKERTGGWDAAREACLPVTSGLDQFTTEEDVLMNQRLAILRRLDAMA